MKLPLAIGIAFILAPIAGLAMIQQADQADYATVRYAQGTPDDAIERLQNQIDSGKVTLAYDSKWGYLPAVLKALRVPVSSQMLVFSKTSVQKELISPQHPRALYFNDYVYVGYVPTGPVLEFATVDPKLGPVYYNLLQRQREKPRFFRNIAQCMECHGARAADHVPVHLMHSVYPDIDGAPYEGTTEFNTTDASPLRERWGGWYVTGRHGNQRHMGNGIAEKHGDTVTMDLEKGVNITDLRPLVDTSPYLSHHSDIVALMVLEHQTHVQNLITKANYELSLALMMEMERAHSANGAPAERDHATMQERVTAVCEPLVRAMLFVGEARLTEPVSGASGFAAEFMADGPRDHKGRSLRDLDLKRRLLRYPCSYMIYSEAFDALPIPATNYVYRRLWEILIGQDRSPVFAHLSAADRTAIREILLATKPIFATWQVRR